MQLEQQPEMHELPQGVVHTWASVMARCPDVVALFGDCQLNLHVTRAACLIGLADKRALQRLLIVRRLPPFLQFRNWCYTVQLVDRFGVEGAISAWALHQGYDPASYYKLVRKTTGRAWGEVRAKGTEWVRGMALQVWAPHL